MKKLLLHVCCAPCAVYVVELLKKDYSVVMFFSNSNLFPQKEYEKRLKNARVVSQKLKVELVVDEYDHSSWLESVKGYEKEPEKGKRCGICFKFNLERTAKFALDNGFDLFATTLTVSPHKNHEIINKIGKQLSEKYKIRYLESNFKKQNGFKHSTDLSKKYNLYRQNYCGCEYSKK